MIDLLAHCKKKLKKEEEEEEEEKEEVKVNLRVYFTNLFVLEYCPISIFVVLYLVNWHM